MAFRFLLRLLLTLVVVFTLTLGGTFNGFLNPQIRLFDIAGLGILMLLWALSRRKRGGIPSTVFDTAIVVGAAALTISFVLNLDVWRRSTIGLWHVGLYLAIWIILVDLLSTKILTRDDLLDALLISGVVIVSLGYLQVRPWLEAALNNMAQTLAYTSPPRPVSALGNPNALAAALVIFLPLIAGRWTSARRTGRFFLLVFAIVTAGLLVLTYSRGGWVGAAVGVTVTLLLGVQRFRRYILIAVGALAVIIALAVVMSLSQAGRSIDTRSWIYDAAWRTFVAHPLGGSGLFTFGRDLVHYYSMPPNEAHAHAHNILLHVAAELGIPGIAALMIGFAITVIALFRSVRQAENPSALGLASGAAGALVGTFTHHLVDVTSMMPAIALLIVAVLALTVTPIRSEKRRSPIFAYGLCLALVVTGLCGSAIYSNYWNSVVLFAPSGEYAEGAQALSGIAESDPYNAPYWYTEGIMWGLAGLQDPTNSVFADNGIRAFEHFVLLEPDYPMGWVNLATLRAQNQDEPGALDAWRTAVDHGNAAWSIAYQQGIYAEIVGESETARTAYMTALRVNPDIRLFPEWSDSPIRQSLVDDAPALSDLGAAAINLVQGNVDSARERWMRGTYRSSPPSLDIRDGMDALIAIESGDMSSAQILRDAMQQNAWNPEDTAWLHFVDARIANANDRPDDTAQALLETRQALEPGDLAADWVYGANIFYGQFLQFVIPRVFLPQAHIDTTFTSAVLEYLMTASGFWKS